VLLEGMHSRGKLASVMGLCEARIVQCDKSA